MGLILRQGIFGEYWGNTYNSSTALNQSQMEINATYIYSHLAHEGWSINAISAILGNMQAESSINPGRWQGNNVGSGPAYGIVQWDPFSKYINWCSEWGFSDPSEMDSNIARILWEVKNKEQWYGRGDFAGMSFEDFSKSTLPVATLAKAFLLCYERPADQSESVQNYRASLASQWYTYLTGVTPSDPTNPETTKKKKGYKFHLFNKRRRVF